MNDSVTILGARGSMPVSGARFMRYGGATVSVAVRLNGQAIVLDAGTGLLSLPDAFLREPTLPLLLTHLHLDHLLGLPMCPYMLRPGARLDLYAAPRSGETLQRTLARLYAPPVWPVGVEQLSAEIRMHELPETLDLGGVRVDTMEGVHAGGVTLFRLSAGSKRVVFATDCTFTDELLPRAAEFARDCDLLLADGQYSEAEWPSRAAFGHSTWMTAALLGTLSGAKHVRVLHHAPDHDDDTLDAAAAEARSVCPRCDFAYEGEEIAL